MLPKALPGICGLAVLLLVSTGPAEARRGNAAAVQGIATCERDSPRGPCYLTWTLPSTSPSHVFIEHFDTSSQAWNAITAPVLADIRRSADVVPGGHLYRVSACASESRAESTCVYTSVHWAPILPETTEEIPDRVDTPGGALELYRNTGLAQQTRAYNHYLVAKLVSETHDFMNTMPPMTRRRVDYLDFTGPNPTSEVDTIEWAVFREYELSRTHCNSRPDGCPFPLDLWKPR